MLFKFYIYLIILVTFTFCWLCISFYTAFLLSITLLAVLEVHDRLVPLDGARAAHHGNDWSAEFNSTIKRRRNVAKTNMFKNWNPFRKKNDKDGSNVTLQSFKQESKPSYRNNKENSSFRPTQQHHQSFQSHSQSHSQIQKSNRTAFKPSDSPRPITLARKGSLKITRLAPVSENNGGTDSFLNKSSFNNSSFKSDRSVNDVSIFNASGPLLSSPFIPQVKEALGFNDTFSPLGSPAGNRNRVKRSNTFHYAPSHPTTTAQGSLPVVRLGRKDRHSFREGNVNSPNTVKIAPPDVHRFPTCRLTTIKERNSSVSSQPPDTQTVVSALRERRKRSFIPQEESIFDDIETTQQSKRRRQESTQSTASSISIPVMPDNFPDLSQSGYTLMPIDSAGVKRPAAPSREPVEDHEMSLAKRPKKENRNDPIMSSLRSSKYTVEREIPKTRKLPIRRHSISCATRPVYLNTPDIVSKIPDVIAEVSRGNVSPADSDISMTSLRNQPTVILSSLKTNKGLRKSNDDLFNGANDVSINETDTSINTSLTTGTSKRLLFDGIKKSTKKRQLSLYPSLDSSFKKVPVSNVVASAEDYEKDREDERKRVTEMLQEITEEHENKFKKDEKLSTTETLKVSTASSITTAIPSATTTATSSILSTKSLSVTTPATTASKQVSFDVAVISSACSTTSVSAPSTTLPPVINFGSAVSSAAGGSSLLGSAPTTATTTQAASSTSGVTATAAPYSFKPVFGAPSTASSQIPSATISTPGLSLAAGSSNTGSMFKLGADLNTPKTTVQTATSTSALTLMGNSSLASGFTNSVSQNQTPVSSPFTGLNSQISQSKPIGALSGFNFGQTSSNNGNTAGIAFGQGLTNPTTTSSSGFSFGLAQSTAKSQAAPATTPAQSSLSLQSGFGQSQPSAPGDFGFGGATALSALQNISALSGLTAPTVPNTNPPPYSAHAPTIGINTSSGLPKPTFNFSSSTPVSTATSTGSVFGSTEFKPITTSSSGVFGNSLNQTAKASNSSPFQFGNATAPSIAPSVASGFGQTSATAQSAFSFGQSKPTTTTQSASPFGFGQTSGGNTGSAFGSQNVPKPFPFSTSQSAPPGGFGTSGLNTAFNPSGNQSNLTFGNKPATQSSVLGTASNSSSVFGATNSSTPVFGAQSGSSFTNTASTFGSSAPTPFPTQTNSGSTTAFGQSSNKSVTPFGAATPQTSFGQSNSVFGALQSGTTGFGQATPSSSAFQFGQQKSNTPLTNAFQFGQTSNTPGSSSFQFGQTTPSKSSIPAPAFGQSAANQNTGFNFAAPGGFGVPTTPSAAPVGAFGTPTTPTNPFTPGSVPKPRAASRTGRRGRTRR